MRLETTRSLHLSLVNRIVDRINTLCSTNTSLEPKSKSLNQATVLHESRKLSWVGSSLVAKIGETFWGGDIATNRPSTHSSLVLLAKDEVVKKLGSLRVRGILENAGILRPRDIFTLCRLGEFERLGFAETSASSEVGSFGGVLLADYGAGSCRSTNPARVLLEEILEPGSSVLLHAGNWSAWIAVRDVRNLHEIKGEKNRVVVGVSQDELVLKLRSKPIGVLCGCLNTAKLLCVPCIGPEEDIHSIPIRRAILESMIDLIKALGGVVEQSALLSPARVIVQGLQDHAVDVN